MEDAHQTARQVLEDRREELDMTSEILLKRETIEREQFIELLAGKSEDEVFLDAAPSIRNSRQHPRRRRRGSARATRPAGRTTSASADSGLSFDFEWGLAPSCLGIEPHGAERSPWGRLVRHEHRRSSPALRR